MPAQGWLTYVSASTGRTPCWCCQSVASWRKLSPSALEAKHFTRTQGNKRKRAWRTTRSSARRGWSCQADPAVAQRQVAGGEIVQQAAQQALLAVFEEVAQVAADGRGQRAGADEFSADSAAGVVAAGKDGVAAVVGVDCPAAAALFQQGRVECAGASQVVAHGRPMRGDRVGQQQGGLLNGRHGGRRAWRRLGVEEGEGLAEAAAAGVHDEPAVDLQARTARYDVLIGQQGARSASSAAAGPRPPVPASLNGGLDWTRTLSGLSSQGALAGNGVLAGSFHCSLGVGGCPVVRRFPARPEWPDRCRSCRRRHQAAPVAEEHRPVQRFSQDRAIPPWCIDGSCLRFRQDQQRNPP